MKNVTTHKNQIKREYGLDILKLICSFLVVHIHAGASTGFVSILSTVAVPAFFVISGFLYQYVVLPKEKQKEQVKKILKTFLLAFVGYCIWSGVVIPVMLHESVWAALQEQLSLIPIAKLVFLNWPTYGYHLWYLSALVYVMVFSELADRYLPEKCAKLSCIVLFVVGVIMPWTFMAFHLPFREELVKNFAFEGFPMFYAGRCLAKNRNGLTAKLSDNKILLYGLGIMLLLLLFAENDIYDFFDTATTLRCLPSAFGIFLVVFAVYIGEVYANRKWFRSTYAVFGGLSTAIYIVHLWVLSLMEIFEIKSFLGCLLISVLVSWLWKVVTKLTRQKKTGNSEEKITDAKT